MNSSLTLTMLALHLEGDPATSEGAMVTQFEQNSTLILKLIQLLISCRWQLDREQNSSDVARYATGQPGYVAQSRNGTVSLDLVLLRSETASRLPNPVADLGFLKGDI